jgi:hypothetical protein
MTDYYLDLVNGSDAASGLTSWANAKKSPDEFVGVAGPADLIKVARTGPVANVTGTWAVTPSASGGSAYIQGDAALGVLDLFLGTASTPVTFYNGAVGGSGSALVTHRPPYNTSRDGPAAASGSYFHVVSPTANTKYAVIDLGSTITLAGYQEILFWVGTSGDSIGMASTSPYVDNNVWRVKLCSDAAGDTVLEEWPLDAPFVTDGSWWARLVSAGNLPPDVRSVALYSGANTVANAKLGFWGAYAVETESILRPGDVIRDTGTNFWTRVSMIEGGETVTPKLYALNLPAYEGYFPEERTGVTLERLQQVHVTSRSGITTAGTARGDIYDGHNIQGLGGVVWEGGYNTGTNTVDSFTLLDLGFDNLSFGSVLAVNNTVATEFQNFVQSGGYAGGSLPFHSAVHAGAVDLNQSNCVHVPGALTMNGTGGEIGGSTYTNCFAYAGAEQFTYSSGTVSLTTTTLMNPASGDWLIEGTLSVSSCTYVHYDGTIGYSSLTNGFTLTTSGTNRFLGEGTLQYRNTKPGIATATDLGPFDIVGHSLSLWQLAPSEKLDYLTYVGQGYAGGAITFQSGVDNPTTGANQAGTLGGTVFDGWSVLDIDSFSLRGFTLANSTVYLQSGGTLEDAAAYGTIYQSCDLGMPTDTGSFDLVCHSGLRLYDCAVSRPVIYKSDPRARLDMLGGAITGTAHDPIRATDAITDLWNLRFHGTVFDSDLTYLDAAGTDFYQRQSWYDNVDGMLSITALDGSPGANRLHNPNWRATTVNSPIRTAGGKSWKVTTQAQLREGSTQWVIARVAVKGGLQLTATVFVYVTNECYAYLKSWPGQIGASPAARVASTNQTGVWEQLSHQFIPSADGVLEYYLTFSTPVSGRIIHVDDFSFEQV